jgi:hypothetical protein
MYRKKSLMISSALAMSGALLGLPLGSGAAQAQSPQSSDKIERLEQQTEALQQQLRSLKDELAQTRKKTAKVEAVQAAYTAAPSAASGNAPAFKAPPWTDKVTMTWGGFLAAESVWRQRNEVADMGSSFGGIPYAYSPLSNEHEFHGSARQSRISLLVDGKIDPAQDLAGYFEMDFLGVGTTSNYNQSNSFAPRLRQGYFSYDNSDWGFHFLGGQAWSLLTQDKAGITARNENIPLTIDASYVAGFNYTRNWQLRAVKDFGPTVSLGISVENPATIVAASTASLATGAGGAFASGGVINGTLVDFNNPGGSFLSTQTITTDQAPDIIEKAAFDPGWGHYELFGIQRFFTDNTLSCYAGPCIAGSTTMPGSAATKTAFGYGVGGSVLLPVVPKFLEFTGNVMYGQGVGRYGAGQLPDATVAADGSLTPIPVLTAMAGVIGHPWDGLDVYAYGGIEQANASYFNFGTALYGYGNPGFSNAGCDLTTPSSFAGATPTTCIANNKRLSEITAGFWQNLYKGSYGRMAVGAQYEYIKREAFPGLGGAPSTDDNIVLTSLRYYPF